MTRNYELDLRDIVDCAHEPELPIVEEGKVVGYVCRCGKTIYIDEPNKKTYHQDPLCAWYTDYCAAAKPMGEVELLEHN